MASNVEKVLSECIECSLCVQQCEFLSLFCESPIELADSFLKEDLDCYIPYLCSLCDLCEEVCPLNLNIGKMCLEMRQKLVRDGQAPLKAHAPLEKEQKRVISEHFSMSFPHPKTGRFTRVFFPGCDLSGYSPALVIAAYEWLAEYLPDTGFMLRCCGAPTRELGNQAVFEEMVTELEDEITKMGATEIIVACPHCSSTFNACFSRFKIKSLYEVMDEAGAIRSPRTNKHPFALHDPCAARWDRKTRGSVRSLLRSAGFRLEEFANQGEKTTCCGMGGMVAYVSPDMSEALRNRRLEETSSAIVSYCAACREAFASRRPALHILDLIFNPEWETDRAKPPHERAIYQDNQWMLKTLLKQKFGLQD